MKPAKSKPPGKVTRKPLTRDASLVRFELRVPGARLVCIAGAFNDWHPGATEMIDLGAGHWVKDLKLPPGVYEYRFVVDGVWCEDPHAMAHVANPFGGRNSVVQVSPK